MPYWSHSICFIHFITELYVKTSFYKINNYNLIILTTIIVIITITIFLITVKVRLEHKYIITVLNTKINTKEINNGLYDFFLTGLIPLHSYWFIATAPCHWIIIICI